MPSSWLTICHYKRSFFISRTIFVLKTIVSDTSITTLTLLVTFLHGISLSSFIFNQFVFVSTIFLIYRLQIDDVLLSIPNSISLLLGLCNPFTLHKLLIRFTSSLFCYSFSMSCLFYPLDSTTGWLMLAILWCTILISFLVSFNIFLVVFLISGD